VTGHDRMRRTAGLVLAAAAAACNGAAKAPEPTTGSDAISGDAATAPARCRASSTPSRRSS
jgi:hypothetical protein